MAVTVLLTLIVSACGNFSGASPPATTGSLSSPTASAQAVPPTTHIVNTAAPSDTLRWSLEGIKDLPSLDPAVAGDTPTFTVMSLIYAGLVRLDERLEVEPEGASEWKVSADGTTYTFTVRNGLTFADGSPVTADDFAFSINRALLPATKSFNAPSQLSTIVGAKDVIAGKATTASGVRVVDARTLEIKLELPQAYFLAQLASPYTHVLPRKLLSSSAHWQEQAYGIGPFTVKEWKHGESLLLTANEHYWRGKPGVTNVLLPFTADSETAFQHYQAGELDIMGSQQNPIPIARVPDVKNMADFHSVAALVTRYIGFNNRKPPFDNPDVRRALALAIDKPTLVKDVLADNVVPADRLLPPGILGTQLAVRPLSFSPTAAKAALDTAGFANGAGLPEITLAYAEEGDTRQVAEALQKMWNSNLGLNIKLQAFNLNDFNRSLDTTYLTPTEGLQFYISTWGADYPDPQNFLSRQLRSDSPNNNGHFSDATFDRLVDEADQLSDRTQIERRVQLYNQAEQLAVDRVGWLPLYYPTFNVLLHPRVVGIIVTANGFIVPDWSKVQLKT